MRAFYARVIDTLGDADCIFIFGPGEIKRELEKRIRESRELGSKIVRVEPADRMTERQIVARVKKLYESIGKQDSCSKR